MVSETSANQPGGKRRQASQARRQAILDAGLDTFIAQGFAAARLDDIAASAGVAKGTIYLSFADKQDLFEQVVLGAIGPVLDNLAAVAERTDAPLGVVLSHMFEMFQREILATKRREIMRLVIAEGANFPKIAEFYHREVIAKGLALIETIARRAHARGELATDALVRFPHLLVGPMLISVVWQSLFAKFEPLDVSGLLNAHRDLLLACASPPEQSK